MTLQYLRRKRQEYLHKWEITNPAEVKVYDTFSVVTQQFIDMLEKDEQEQAENPVGRGI